MRKVMHRRAAISLLYLLASAYVQAATLKGVILANELGGAPVPNVQITTVAGANPTASLNDGTFSLQFPGKQPGELVQLVVRKPGYVVVNDIQLRLPLPKDPEAEPLVIFLCKEGDREEMARRFYRLKSVEAVEQFYQKRLKELEEKNQATVAALEELHRDRDQAKAAAEKTAEELARSKPVPTSEIYQQAMSLFLSGKPEEALKILNLEALRHSAEVARQHRAEAEKEAKKAEKEVKEAIQNYLLRAQLLVTLFRFDEAEKTYQEAIELQPDNLQVQFSFAYFNQKLNRFSEALVAYGRVLELARQSGHRSRVAMTLNNLGILYRDLNRMEEALRSYEEAL
jgi:tetratricopeptide (TPR) repeat protein